MSNQLLREALEEMVRCAQKQNWRDNYPSAMDKAYAALEATKETQSAAGEPTKYWAFRNEDGELCITDRWDVAKHFPFDLIPLVSPTTVIAHPAAAHGDEAVRKDATESAIQRACKELPEGWSMQIELERGAGDVTLFNAWDIVVDFGQDFESSISEQVEAAIDAAMRAQGNGGTV